MQFKLKSFYYLSIAIEYAILCYVDIEQKLYQSYKTFLVHHYILKLLTLEKYTFSIHESANDYKIFVTDFIQSIELL